MKDEVSATDNSGKKANVLGHFLRRDCRVITILGEAVNGGKEDAE